MTVKQIQKIINDKVKGIWVAEHDEKGHWYRNTKDNRKVASVTSQNVLAKDHLIPWASGLAVQHFIERIEFYDPKNIEQTERMVKEAKLAYTAVRDSAGDIGTIAHDVIEQYLNGWISTGIKPEMNTYLDGAMDAKVWAACRSVEGLFGKLNMQPIATELLVGSEKIDSAGTLDFLVIIDGKLWILDWKTSNQVSDQYAIQVSAYQKFFEEMTGLKVEGSAIVWLSKNYDKVKLYDIPFINRAYSVFRHQNKIYQWLRDGRDKLIERKNRVKI